MFTFALRPSHPLQPASSILSDATSLVRLTVDDAAQLVISRLEDRPVEAIALASLPPILESPLGLEALFRAYKTRAYGVGYEVKHLSVELEQTFDDATIATLLRLVSTQIPNLLSFALTMPRSSLSAGLPLTLTALPLFLSDLTQLISLTFILPSTTLPNDQLPQSFITALLTTLSCQSAPSRLSHLTLPLPYSYLSFGQPSHLSQLLSLLSLPRSSSSLTHLDLGRSAILDDEASPAVLSILEDRNPWLEQLSIQSEGEMMESFKRRALRRNTKLRQDCRRSAEVVRRASEALLGGTGRRGRLPMELVLQVIHEMEPVALSWRQVENIIQWAAAGGEKAFWDTGGEEAFLRKVDCWKYDGEGIEDGKW